MEFTTVNTDDTDEMDEDELREVVSEFEDAQTQNLAEFKTAKEDLNEYEDVDVSVAEAQEFKEDIIDDVEDDSPLTRDELSSFGLSRLRELKAEFVSEQEAAEGEDATTEQVEDDEGGEFSDMGTRGETDGESVEFGELADKVDSITGLEVN
jgi:hypothetical protein